MKDAKIIDSSTFKSRQLFHIIRVKFISSKYDSALPLLRAKPVGCSKIRNTRHLLYVRAITINWLLKQFLHKIYLDTAVFARTSRLSDTIIEFKREEATRDALHSSYPYSQTYEC